MQSLDRIKLLQKEKLEIEEVILFENPKTGVFVRGMTGRDRDRFEQSLLKEVKDDKGVVITVERSMEDYRAKLAVCTVCTSEGKAVFEPLDAATLSQNMSAKTLEKITKVAQQLNGMGEVEKENVIKNSDAVRDGNSNSDSAKN